MHFSTESQPPESLQRSETRSWLGCSLVANGQKALSYDHYHDDDDCV